MTKQAKSFRQQLVSENNLICFIRQVLNNVSRLAVCGLCLTRYLLCLAGSVSLLCRGRDAAVNAS